MSKEVMINNILLSLEELSEQEAKSENDLIRLRYKDLNYYFTDLYYETAKAFLKEMQKD